MCQKKKSLPRKMTIRKESEWENVALDCFWRYFYLNRKSAPMQGILKIIFG